MPVAGYAMNICNLSKEDIDALDKIVKEELRNVGYHGTMVPWQASDERLYTERREGGRGMRNFKDDNKNNNNYNNNINNNNNNNK